MLKRFNRYPLIIDPSGQVLHGGVPLLLSRVSDLLFWCDPIFKILGLSLNPYHNIIIIKAQLKSIRMF